MTIKKTVLAFLTITVIMIIFSNCAPRRRWYSTYRDKNGEVKTEHYNQYRKKWYQRNWNNGQMWK
jgi:hypothetical protein